MLDREVSVIPVVDRTGVIEGVIADSDLVRIVTTPALTLLIISGSGKSPRQSAYADTHYEGVHRASVWTADRQCQKASGSKEIEDDAFVYEQQRLEWRIANLRKIAQGLDQ